MTVGENKTNGRGLKTSWDDIVMFVIPDEGQHIHVKYEQYFHNTIELAKSKEKLRLWYPNIP